MFNPVHHHCHPLTDFYKRFTCAEFKPFLFVRKSDTFIFWRDCLLVVPAGLDPCTYSIRTLQKIPNQKNPSFRPLRLVLKPFRSAKSPILSFKDIKYCTQFPNGSKFKDKETNLPNGLKLKDIEQLNWSVGGWVRMFTNSIALIYKKDNLRKERRRAPPPPHIFFIPFTVDQGMRRWPRDALKR